MNKHAQLKWAKFLPCSDITFVSNHVFTFICDDTIAFKDLNTGDENYYRASGDDFGDGVACIAGHRMYYFFAFAELSLKPRIFILSYPQFVTLQVISNTDVYGKYSQVKFSQGEYLIALTGYPEYKIKMWNFRLGELVVEQKTEVIAERQILKMNNAYPFLIAQYAPKIGKIMMWEAHASGEKTFLIKRPVNIPFLSRDNRISITFAIDGLAYITDAFGNLYSVAPFTGAVKLLFQWGALKPCFTNICPYKGGFVITGPENFVKFVKKVENTYKEIWSFQNDEPLVFIGATSNFDVVCILDTCGTCLSLDDSDEKRRIIGEVHRSVSLFDLLYPQGEYVVVLTKHDELRLVEIATEKTVSEVTDLLNITCLLSHPDYPVVFTGDMMCAIKLISYYNPQIPKVLAEFFIGGGEIKSLQFSPSRQYLIVSDKDGEFYVITGLTSQIECIGHFNCEYYTFNYSTYETATVLGIIFIISKDVNSKTILTKEALHVTVQKKDFKIKKTIIKLPSVYTSLTPIYAKEISNTQILAAPLNHRHIHILEVTDSSVKQVSSVPTIHQLKSFKIFSDPFNIVTCGLDGMVCVFDIGTKTLATHFFGCNRLRGSVLKACCTPNRRYGVCFSSTKSLKCIEFEHYRTNLAIPPIPKFDTVFEKPITGYMAPEEDPDRSWLVMEKKKKLDEETDRFKHIKQKLHADFTILQGKLKDLLNKNEAAEEIDQLETFKFNLSLDWVKHVKELARLEREEEERLFKAYIEDQNRITKYIINITWDMMEVNSRTVRGIFSGLSCENFALTVENNNEELMTKIALLRIAERLTRMGDCLFPWIPKWASYYTFNTGKPIYGEEEYRPKKFDTRISETDTTDLSNASKTFYTKFALSGTSTHEFVEPNDITYDQLEVVSFYQMYIQDLCSQSHMLELKKYFNKEFLELMKMKDDQITYVKERNDRLRYIQLELITLAHLRGDINILEPEPIEDPGFSADEMPETIIKVEENEVKNKPYISPSRQKILDELAYQAELRRLALLADDFRERALMAMMDGVLERRWEDEIKKDPPPPDCIKKQKDPYEYTKEDHRSIQEWEEKINFVRSERERYQVMLLEEQTKIQYHQDEGIIKFNIKCGESFLLKVRVDAAIRQEELKVLRTSMYNTRRLVFKDMEKDIVDESTRKRVLNEELAEKIEELDKLMQDCRLRYDQLQARDKLLDKQFKSQFAEFAPGLVVDQAYKFFKRRPKWPQRAWATASILKDMALRISQKNSSREGLPLPEECYEFVQLVESIDSFNLAPNTLDQHLWGILCRMRRHKMDSEFRVKACGAQLAEAEASFNAFTRELQNKKTALGSLDRNLQDLKQKYKEHVQNRYIQIVMPMGLVETPLTGRLADFDGCVLLHSADVGDINEIIKRAGRKKLAAMERLAIFRRKIIFKEWQHKVFQLTLSDFQKLLSHIEKCKVTIEMQQWLRRKREGRTEDLSNAALSREIEMKRAHLQSMLNEIDKKIEETKNKVEEQKRSNSLLDKKIKSINIDVTEQNLRRDVFLEEKVLRDRKERMKAIIDRGKLVRKVQANHGHILELATLLELQRLRTYPTLAAPKSYCT